MVEKDALWIVAELTGSGVAPVTLQLITKARKIAGTRSVTVVLLEGSTDSYETELAAYGSDEILIVQDDRLREGSDRVVAWQLTKLAQDFKPNAMLFGATPEGRSIAPRIQDRLRTGLTADCLDLYYENEVLVQVKPSYGDNVMCEITCPTARPQMASVRPNTFEAVRAEAETKIFFITGDIKDDPSWQVDRVDRQIASHTDLKDVTKVLALGRGAAKDEQVRTVRQLAKTLGASIGVTRPLTDLPDFTIAQQIGQSGLTIAPAFILNLGISGAIQYQVGMAASKLIVSVNRDENAPMLAQSDYVYVGDAGEFTAALAKQLQ